VRVQMHYSMSKRNRFSEAQAFVLSCQSP